LTADERQAQALPTFPSLATETLPRQVARAIIGSILVGHFKPDEKLPAAADLAREFDVSRPVIREALKIVSTLGMVTSRQGRYSRVAGRASWHELAPELVAARLEVGAIEDIITDSLELRRVIETEAAALAAQRATDDDLSALQLELNALSEAAETDAYMAHDVAFHDAILRATHNALFLQLIDQMREVLVLTRSVSVTARRDRVAQSREGHEAIFEAIRARSPEQARKAMADHLGWAERVNVKDFRLAHSTDNVAAVVAGDARRSRSATGIQPQDESARPATRVEVVNARRPRR